jgi:hypothetical protein
MTTVFPVFPADAPVPADLGLFEAKSIAYHSAIKPWSINMAAAIAQLQAEMQVALNGIGVTIADVTGGKSGRLFLGADEIVSLPRIKAASGVLSATQGYGFVGDSGVGWENPSVGVLQGKVNGVLRKGIYSDGSIQEWFGSGNLHRLARQSDGNIVLYVNNVAQLIIGQNGSYTALSPGQHGHVVERTDAGFANQIIGSFEYKAKDSAGAMRDQHKIIVQQQSIGPASYGSNVYYQGAAFGVLRDYLIWAGWDGSVRLNGSMVQINNNGDFQLNQSGAGVVFPSGAKQSTAAVGDNQDWRLDAYTHNVWYGPNNRAICITGISSSATNEIHVTVGGDDVLTRIDLLNTLGVSAYGPFSFLIPAGRRYRFVAASGNMANFKDIRVLR